VISAVTLAELSVGPLVATNRKERAARQAVLQQAEADFERGTEVRRRVIVPNYATGLTSRA
jgi:hypothetical protein